MINTLRSDELRRSHRDAMIRRYIRAYEDALWSTPPNWPAPRPPTRWERFRMWLDRWTYPIKSRVLGAIYGRCDDED